MSDNVYFEKFVQYKFLVCYMLAWKDNTLLQKNINKIP